MKVRQYFTGHGMVGVIVLLSSLSSAPATAGFTVDQSSHDLRKSLDMVVLDDLAIEETGLVSDSPGFCTEDGKLFLWKYAELSHEVSDYGWTYRVTRKQGNKVTIEARPSPNSDWHDLAKMLLWLSYRSCSSDIKKPGDLFEVLSINGTTKWTDLVKSLK